MWSPIVQNGVFLQSHVSDVNYDRRGLYWLSFVSTTQAAHRCSYAGLVPVTRNARMFLEYLKYVGNFLPIAQQKTHKNASLQECRHVLTSKY